MSRRYPAADVYEERERDFYARPRQERNYEDIEVDINRTRYADRPASVVSDRRSTRGPKVPDFLREDYGRTSAGPLVVKERVPDDFPDNVSRRGGPSERLERDELVIRERRTEPPQRERPPPSRDPRDRDIEREEIIFRRGEHNRSQPQRHREREREVEETDVIIRRGEQEPPRGPPPPDIVFRRGNGERRPPPPKSEVDDEEFIYRRREETRSPPARSERGVDREEIVIRERERSIPPPRRRSLGPVAREKEEWLFRRREQSPPREEREEIIIRHRAMSPPREPSPEPVREPTPEPSPPPPPQPIMRPPIIQEIITHHHHIDHGVKRAVSPVRSPSPPPPPPSPPPAPKDESLEIEIRRRNTRNGYDENITFEREISQHREPERHERTLEVARSRSVSGPRRRHEDDFAAEADYYNRKAQDRGYIGEAYNGATRDWGLVDIPPGTRRVQMEGMGGGRQDITWQQYNGSRRSKFYVDDEVYASDFGPGGPPPERIPERKEERRKVTKDMWTEVTKDLVSKEAIETMGYEFEENENFFYVMEYLKYEDVLQLVELSEQIRQERRERIRQIQWEREELERLPPPKPRSKHDERIYEREVIYEAKRSGRHR